MSIAISRWRGSEIAERGSCFYAAEHGIAESDYDGTYHQDDMPISQHSEIKGHAVRAAYLMSGVTDVVAETGESSWSDMLDRVWKNTVLKRVFCNRRNRNIGQERRLYGRLRPAERFGLPRNLRLDCTRHVGLENGPAPRQHKVLRCSRIRAV